MSHNMPMKDSAIPDIQRIFPTRLDTRDDILNPGEKHLRDINFALKERLAPDMFTLGTQVDMGLLMPHVRHEP